MSTLQTRQPRGITSGGQFAAAAHAESDVALGTRFSAAELEEFAKPIGMQAGSAVYIAGQRGTVSHFPAPKSRIVVVLDSGGTIHAKAADAAPWDSWLDATMPAVKHDLLDGPVPEATADRMLHGILRGVRNSYSSAEELGDTYHEGRAAAGAEIAASLLDTRLDPAGIRAGGKKLLTAEVIGTLHDRDRLAAHTSGAEISPLRARQLAGYFISQAVKAHTEAVAQEGQGNHGDAQIHHGRSHAHLAGALRFVQGCETDPHALDREHAMIRSVTEGNDRPDVIIHDGLHI